jgi:hypothetical protein
VALPDTGMNVAMGAKFADLRVPEELVKEGMMGDTYLRFFKPFYKPLVKATADSE